MTERSNMVKNGPRKFHRSTAGKLERRGVAHGIGSAPNPPGDDPHIVRCELDGYMVALGKTRKARAQWSVNLDFLISERWYPQIEPRAIARKENLGCFAA